MPILRGANAVAAKLSRSASNALRVQLSSSDGAVLGNAQQKGSAGVLFGFKSGGKSNYTLSGADGEQLEIAVAGTTTISKGGATVGKIVPADSAWHHRIPPPPVTSWVC